MPVISIAMNAISSPSVILRSGLVMSSVYQVGKPPRDTHPAERQLTSNVEAPF